MDDFDVFTSKSSTTQENDLFGSENTNETIHNGKDDSSWIIENNPESSTSVQRDGDNSNSSTPIDQTDNILEDTTSPQTFNDNVDIFENYEQSNTSPPMAEEIISTKSENKSSYNMFSNEETSPLYAINKKREEEIAAKDAEETRKIDELRQQAKTDLERWYKDRQSQMEQNRKTMKNDENDLRSKSLEKSTKELCDWSKVIRLLEFTDGTQLSKSKRDVTRMKSCMLTAKRANDNKKLANGT